VTRSDDEVETMRETCHLAADALPVGDVASDEPIDYDLHGIVGVRLLGAGPGDARAVDRQLGPIRASLEREPDLVLRFVDRLPLREPLRLLGLDDVGFSEDAFVVLRSRHKAPARVAIPFDRIGGRCEIVCERGLPAVPFLVAVVNLTALANGWLPLHASAFLWRETGVLATGWAKGGKTETLLAFVARGASYVGDEWVYLSGDGRRMVGIPEPIRVWDWHLDELPALRRGLPARQRARLRALSLAASGLRTAAGSGLPGSALARRALPLLERQRYVHLPPRETFGEGACTPVASPDRIVFVASHESPEIRVRAIDPDLVARRMVFSLEDERRELLSCWSKFRFAFPDARNALLEGASARELALLRSALVDRPTLELLHPYPVAIPSLFDALEPHC
jgi:hypothetical protein